MGIVDTFTATSGTSSTTSTTLALTVPRAVSAGQSIVLATSRADTGSQATGLSSITDSRGNTWVRSDAISLRANVAQVALSHCHVTTGLQVGDTITVTWTSQAARRSIIAHVVTGLQTVNPEATSGTAVTAGVNSGPNGSSNTPTATTGATSTAQCLVVGAVGCGSAGAPLTPGTGYTAGATAVTSVGSADRALLTEYKTTAAAGTQTADGTLGQSATWAEAAAAYPLATGTGTPISAPVSAQGTNSGTGANTTVTVPAGATVGAQGLVIFMGGQGSPVDASDLTGKGWSPVTSYVINGIMGLQVWGKAIIAADLGSTLTIVSTVSTSIKRTMDVLCYPGATLGNSGAKQATANSAAHTGPTQTAVAAGAWVVNVFVDKGDPGSTSFTLPANLTSRQQFEHTGGSGISSVVADDDNVGSGTVGGNTVTGTIATLNALQATIVLEPGAAPNVPPVANAGPDLTDVEPWALAQVGGTDTDTDGTIAGIAWTQDDGVDVTLYSDTALTVPSTAAATVYFQAPPTIGGTTVALTKTVADNNGATDSDQVTVQVLPVTERVMVGGVEVPLRILRFKA